LNEKLQNHIEESTQKIFGLSQTQEKVQNFLNEFDNFEKFMSTTRNIAKLNPDEEESVESRLARAEVILTIMIIIKFYRH